LETIREDEYEGKRIKHGDIQDPADPKRMDRATETSSQPEPAEGLTSREDMETTTVERTETVTDERPSTS
jgi:hypothetical protein